MYIYYIYIYTYAYKLVKWWTPKITTTVFPRLATAVNSGTIGLTWHQVPLSCLSAFAVPCVLAGRMPWSYWPAGQSRSELIWEGRDVDAKILQDWWFLMCFDMKNENTWNINKLCLSRPGSTMAQILQHFWRFLKDPGRLYWTHMDPEES